MNQHYVRLCPEFLSALRRAGIPAIPRRIEDWLIQEKQGVRRGCMAKLLNGELQRPIVIAKLMKYLRENPYQGSEQHDRKLVEDHLIASGNESLLKASHQQVALTLHDQKESSWLWESTRRFIDMDGFRDLMVPRTYSCNTDDLTQAVDWMMLDYAKQIYPERSSMTLKQAERILIERGNMSKDRFLESAVRWLRYDPWTCIVGRDEKQRYGMSVILPLTLEAYTDFRNGNRHPCDFVESDLCRPSRHLMLQAISFNPKVKGFTPENVQNKLFGNIVHQVAMLSHCDGELGRFPLNIITFGSTPLTQKRLESDGYGRLNAVIPETEIPLYERDFSETTLFKQPKNVLVKGLLSMLGSTSAYQLAPSVSLDEIESKYQSV